MSLSRIVFILKFKKIEISQCIDGTKSDRKYLKNKSFSSDLVIIREL